MASEKNLQISYHLDENADVGYLELLSAPWNSKQTILYVGGSSDLGLRHAAAALQFGRLRSKLNGNLAFINGEQVVTANTTVFQVPQSALPTAPPVIDVTPGVHQQAGVERPTWILPTIFTILGGIILLLLVLGMRAIVRKRSGK
jgi:hypothetical protein